MFNSKSLTVARFGHSSSNKWLSKRQILDFSKLKEYADDNFKFDEMTESSPNG